MAGLGDTAWNRRCNLREKQFTIDYILYRLHYDPYSGNMYFKTYYEDMVWSSINAGALVSDAVVAEVYQHFKLDGVDLLVHRVACAMMLGDWPTCIVDHKNRKVNDNKWDNIRPATFSQNRSNSKQRTDNKLGFKGVSYDGKRFNTRITMGGRQRTISSHATAELAAAAYDRAAVAIRGEFACTNFSLGLLDDDPQADLPLSKATNHRSGVSLMSSMGFNSR